MPRCARRETTVLISCRHFGKNHMKHNRSRKEGFDNTSTTASGNRDRRCGSNFDYSPDTGSGSCCMNSPRSLKCGRMPPIVSKARMWFLIMRCGTGPLNSIMRFSICVRQHNTHQKRNRLSGKPRNDTCKTAGYTQVEHKTSTVNTKLCFREVRDVRGVLY